MAGRIQAVVGSLAFLFLAPGVVAGPMPWPIAGWRPLPDRAPNTRSLTLRFISISDSSL